MGKRILLVGGGTGGHIFPLYHLAKELIGRGCEVHLIVNNASLDKKIVQEDFANLKTLQVHYLQTYKIDYHLSLRNLVAPFKILSSFLRTQKLLKKIDPEVVFFKGGFVGFPVLVALKYLMRFKGKIYLHDSDISAGALTQFIGKRADHIFTNFGDSPTPLFYWPQNVKVKKPHNTVSKILVFGGSQGADFLNKLVIHNLGSLVKNYDTTLVTGPKNRLETHLSGMPRFEHHPFLAQEVLLQKILEADIVIARSGASVFQVLAAKTKLICVPLPTAARNHQLHNAEYFKAKGLCYLLQQNTETNDQLLPMIQQILEDKDLEKNLADYEGLPQVEAIANEITQT